MKFVKELFPVRLRQIREQRGWTQTQLADKLDISKALLNNYETGRHTPQFKKLPRLAQVLGVDVAWLMGFTE